ncbi:heavy metal-associated domain-containing protein [Pedobacter sp. JY14-1]|uniref:heavy-metal-associated domain-containing protein n=1 Tax=Pedobacter sp. JY14-1 TaxID=3034151 RepID=UPI0023E341F3|nr:heavy metal-associated domain-containing protein [Pedobacter sp. JY14-1]
MKTIRLFIIILLSGAAGASAQQISTAELQVTGLTCSMCSQATEKSLRSLDFVESIKPDLNKNIFMISFKKGRPINVDQIRKKVQDAGFSVGNLSAMFSFSNLKVDAQGQATDGGTVYKFANASERTLNGEIRATIIDRNFISPQAFKQYAARLKSPAYASGYGEVNGKKTRIYHLSI